MENRNSFSIRNLVLQILLIILFVFIMIWLFPTKSYMEEKFITEDELNSALKEQLTSLYGRTYADNMESMRDAAKDYFTTSRLPKTEGSSVTLTLKEMIDRKLVLGFTDSNGQKCDVNSSYVKLTKMEDEYQLKIQLTCSDYSDYIIDYIGCYSYCEDCTKPSTPKPSTSKPSTSKPSKPTETKPTETKPTETKPTEVVSKNYIYEYVKVNQNTYSDWSNWSNWSTSRVSANNFTQVEMDRRQELTGYSQDYKITGYRTESYTDYENKPYTDYVSETYTDYVSQTVTKYRTETYTDYEYKTVTTNKTTTQSVPTGTKSELVDTKAATYTPGSLGNWYDAGTITTKNRVLTSTDTVEYTILSSSRVLDSCDTACTYITQRVYKVRKRNTTAGSYSCPSGYTLNGTNCNKYETRPVYSNQTVNTPTTSTVAVPVTKTRTVPYTTVEKVPVTKTRQVPVTRYRQVAVTKTRQVPVYGYVSGDPIYKTVTYYRFRTRTQLTTAGVEYKYSESNTDTSLLNNGYKLTGKVQEV